MESRLPSNLLYFVSTLQNYSTNTVKLQTLNQTSLASNGSSQLRLALPVNAVVNLKSLSLHTTFSTTGVAPTGAAGADANGIYALIPKGGVSAVIDRLSFSAGGIALDSGFSNYNVVQALRENIEKSADKYMSDDAVLQQALLEPVDYNDTYTQANYGQQKQLIQNNFMGFLEAAPAYLDLNRVPEIFLTLQLANKAVIPIQAQSQPLGTSYFITNEGFNGNECNFAMDDIFFSIEVVSIGSGLYDSLTDRVLSERGNLDVPYPQYQTFSTDMSQAGGSIRASVSTMSLDRLWCVQRNAVNRYNKPGQTGDVNDANAPYQIYTQQQPPVPAEDNTTFAFTNANLNFISQGISDWFYTINNSPVPLYKPGTVDAFNFAVCADDRTYSKDRGGLVGSQLTWLNNCWCAPVKLCHDRDMRLVSGMNLMSINSQINFTTTGDGSARAGTARNVLLCTQQKSLLRIGPQRSIAVIA